MPICFNGNSSAYPLAGSNPFSMKSPTDFQKRADRCLHVGLINNMPDAALEATERQFLTLIQSAADGVLVRVTLYALPNVPRNDACRQHISRYYSGIEDLWNDQLDG